MRAVFKAGAAGSIAATVGAPGGGVYAQSSGTVTQALSDLQTARSYCSGLTGQAIPATLDGQTLTAGTYTISSAATLGAAANLTLSGDSTSIFVFTLASSLTLDSDSRVQVSGSVRPEHIYWNVQGTATVQSRAALPGIVLTSAATLKLYR